MIKSVSLFDRLPRVFARRQLWLARGSWLLVALAALVIFAAGLPLFVDNLQAKYRRDIGVSLQRNAAGDIIVLPWMGEQAAQAGVMERDVLVTIDGNPVTEPVVPSGAAGTAVTLGVRTGEQPLRQVTLIRGGEDGRLLARLGLPVSVVIAVAVGVEMLVLLGFVGAAVFIFWRRGQSKIGWLSSLILIVFFGGGASLSMLALYRADLAWQYLLDAWISLALGGLLLFLLWFPGERFAPRWTAVFMVAWFVWAIAAWFVPDLYFWRLAAPSLTFITGAAAWLGIGVAAQVWRYRFVSNIQQRQQTKWVVWSISVASTAILAQYAADQFLLSAAPLFDLLINPLTRLLQLLIPVTLLFAIFQRRLWQIDVIFNRTLVYGGMTVLIIAVYVVVVGGFSAIFQTQGNLLLTLLATGLIALLFQPARERLQRGANRLMFGERDDPYAALSRLGAKLQTTATPEAMLQSVVATIAATLRLPYAAIELVDKAGRLDGAATGTAVADTVEFPLRYQKETVGYLVVSPRSPGESFTQRERRLLADMAGQTGAMAYAVRLTAALQRSREKLVLAREEERRRIRRDLHDGLGPTLASQTFALDAALDLLETDPATAAELLQSLKTQNQETVADIRRLVYELRPPALDELGVIGALQAHVAQLNGRSTPQIKISAAPDPLPPLSAAVEVAAYRIALEAITNVVRHAEAQRCAVSLRVDRNDRFGALSAGRAILRIEVSDDGVGLPLELQPGVGLSSMRERAEELGGWCEVVSGEESGTRVTAVLPMNDSELSQVEDTPE